MTKWLRPKNVFSEVKEAVPGSLSSGTPTVCLHQEEGLDPAPKRPWNQWEGIVVSWSRWAGQ